MNYNTQNQLKSGVVGLMLGAGCELVAHQLHIGSSEILAASLAGGFLGRRVFETIWPLDDYSIPAQVVGLVAGIYTASLGMGFAGHAFPTTPMRAASISSMQTSDRANINRRMLDRTLIPSAYKVG